MAAAAPDARNWLLTIAYDGTAYAGWQLQPGQPTIQGALHEALRPLFPGDWSVEGCSRTDSGVHALGQLATFRAPAWPPIPAGNLQTILNHRLPPDIRVLAVGEPAPDFHVRRDVCGKAYTYVLCAGTCPSPFLARYCWQAPPPLDEARMQEAAPGLLGTHDFTAFSVNQPHDPPRDPVRTLYRLDVQRFGRLLTLTVIGDRFLYRMVRRLTGCLAAVGNGRLAPADVPRILASRERNAGFDTAPPQGLFLARVFCRKEELDAYRCRELPFLAFLDPPPEAAPASS